jgi:putative transposase
MPRGPRNAPGGLIYHVLNRGVRRQTLFHKPADFEAFERIMVEALDEVPVLSGTMAQVTCLLDWNSPGDSE